MSSEESRPYQTEEITDISTAKLALRWSLEKIRQLDEEVQKLSNRLIGKEEEAYRLSKELAHQSNVSFNEKEITQKTQELLEEYRIMMGASMEQLWRKYAPQQAEFKNQLEDKIKSLEHDLNQLNRARNLNDENLNKAEENLARVDRERLEMAKEVQGMELEIAGYREKLVALEPEIQRR